MRVNVTKMHAKWHSLASAKETDQVIDSLEKTVDKSYSKVLYSMKLLKSIVEQHRDIGPQNYFYFSGYMSGILLNSK